MNIHAFLKFCKEYVIPKKGFRPTLYFTPHCPGVNEKMYCLPYQRFVTKMIWTEQLVIFTIVSN